MIGRLRGPRSQTPAALPRKYRWAREEIVDLRLRVIEAFEILERPDLADAEKVIQAKGVLLFGGD